jgi:manganese efflux pump family protein
MDALTLLLISFGLAMDAFAVSLSCGICGRPRHWRLPVRVGLYFGGFQAVMPVLGWLAGTRLRGPISSVDHWVAFGLLASIGVKMIHESFAIGAKRFDPRKHRVLLTLAVATSIDALAVGLSFALLDGGILIPALVIGTITFCVSCAGVMIGDRIGSAFEKAAEILGGLILIGIGLKILLEHTLIH